jgi:hypothetical protein
MKLTPQQKGTLFDFGCGLGVGFMLGLFFCHELIFTAVSWLL